jgi:hypothetical protein
MPKGCNGLCVEELLMAFKSRCDEERVRLKLALDEPALLEAIKVEFARLQESLDTDDETWKEELPGRPILKSFATKARIDIGTLKRLYIKCAQSHDRNPFSDIRNIFRDFAQFGTNQVQ